jgi:hypothetical protein
MRLTADRQVIITDNPMMGVSGSAALRRRQCPDPRIWLAIRRKTDYRL